MGLDMVADGERTTYASGMRWASFIVSIVLWLALPVTEAQAGVHDTQITIPAQFDFTLASLTLHGPAVGLRIATTGPTGSDYVAAAAKRDSPRHIFILVVNRLPHGSLAPTPASITLRIETRNVELAPTLVQHVDVLADGAPGQDCSALPGRPLFGSELHALLGGHFGPYNADEALARALDQACGKPIDSEFKLLVSQEPRPPHP
jgi:hypothetical protein